MPACGRNFEHAFGAVLALHIGKVRRGDRRGELSGDRRRQAGAAREMIDHGNETWHGDGAFSGPGRFRAADGRADQTQLHGLRGHGGRQHTKRLTERAIKRELPDRRMPVQGVRRYDAHGSQQAERNGEVVVAAFLGQVSRREIDGYAGGRNGEADGREGGAHTLAALAHGLVRQADNREKGISGSDVDLHVHGLGLYAFKGKSRDTADHGDFLSVPCLA